MNKYLCSIQRTKQQQKKTNELPPRLQNLLWVPLRNTTRLIRRVQPGLLPGDLARRGAVARGDIQRGVPEEEIPRPQEHRHGLYGHDGEILGSGKMREAESVPEHDVGVFDALVAVLGDPLWKPSGRFSGCLRHVATCRVDLIVVI